MPAARSTVFAAPEHWRSDWAADSPLFAPLAWLTPHLPADGWPDQAAYDQLAELQADRQSRSIRFLLPDNLPDDQLYYENRIHLSGEIPTRFGNWHDFFNAAVWLTFPRSKQALNLRHIQAMKQSPHAGRGPLRDAATLLDESGILLPYCDPELPQLLRQHNWEALFVARRAMWGKTIDAVVFGHAIYEKALAPYIGFTAKALPLAVTADFFRLPAAQRFAELDSHLAKHLNDPQQLNRPSDMSPLPVLGVPGWWPANADPAFYADRDYFRPCRNSSAGHSARPNT